MIQTTVMLMCVKFSGTWYFQSLTAWVWARGNKCSSTHPLRCLLQSQRWGWGCATGSLVHMYCSHSNIRVSLHSTCVTVHCIPSQSLSHVSLINEQSLAHVFHTNYHNCVRGHCNLFPCVKCLYHKSSHTYVSLCNLIRTHKGASELAQ